MSMLSKFAKGVADGVSEYSQGIITEKMEARRQERLAAAQIETAKTIREQTAEFEDSRYDLERDRRLTEAEDELKLKQKYGTTKGSADWEIREIGEEIVDGVAQKKYGRFNKRTGEVTDMEGNPLAKKKGPVELTPLSQAQFDILRRKKPGKSIDELRAEAEARGYSLPEGASVDPVDPEKPEAEKPAEVEPVEKPSVSSRFTSSRGAPPAAAADAAMETKQLRSKADAIIEKMRTLSKEDARILFEENRNILESASSLGNNYVGRAAAMLRQRHGQPTGR